MPEETPTPAPEPTPEPAPGSDSAPGSGATPPVGGPESAAEAALKAAQQAIASLSTDAAKAPPASEPDNAILAAARAAIASAKGVSAAAASASPAAMSDPEPEPEPLPLPKFTTSKPQAKPEGIDLLADVSLNVKIELGRTRMLVEDVLKLGRGAVVELDKLAGDPVDIFVNERPVARGEVLVLNDLFCVRVHEILKPDDDAA